MKAGSAAAAMSLSKLQHGMHGQAKAASARCARVIDSDSVQSTADTCGLGRGMLLLEGRQLSSQVLTGIFRREGTARSRALVSPPHP